MVEDAFESAAFEVFAMEGDGYKTGAGGMPKKMMRSRDCGELFSRCLRFSRWLRFYDAHLGKASQPWRFKDGIEYILRLWQATKYFTPERVQIFTLHDRATWTCRIPTLKREVIDPLRGSFPFDIELIAKERGAIRDVHARFLETELVVVRVDRGFDFFNSRGDLLCNWVNVEEGARSDVKRWRDLWDAGSAIT